MLVATSLVSGAAATDINQQPAPSTGEAPAFALPAFLDGARLPDLQDAWRARFNGQGASAVVQPAGEMAAPQPDMALQPVAQAEQTSRAAVRTRAEELSSRFGADAEPAPGTAPAGTADVPTETASVDAGANAAEAGQPVVQQVLAPAEDSVAAEVAAATDDAPVIEDMGAKPVKSAKRVTSSTPERQAVQTAVHKAPPATSALLKVDPTAPKPEANPLMPSELRAFGWNAQP